MHDSVASHCAMRCGSFSCSLPALSSIPHGDESNTNADPCVELMWPLVRHSLRCVRRRGCGSGRWGSAAFGGFAPFPFSPIRGAGPGRAWPPGESAPAPPRGGAWRAHTDDPFRRAPKRLTHKRERLAHQLRREGRQTHSTRYQ